MINFAMGRFASDVADLMSRFQALPNHIAKKHAGAAVKRVMKFAIPVLKRNTPKRKTFVRFGGGRRGAEFTATKVRGGSLRASVIAKSKYKREKTGSVVYGIVGYSTKPVPAEQSYATGITQSRKAIWLESGTKHAFARGMVKMTMRQVGKPAAENMAKELAHALEKAARELESKKNPGRPV